METETARRLAKFESELAAATREFALGLQTRVGAVPSLDEAADAMQLATDELTGRRSGPAVEHQQTALAELVKARQNLRKFLSQSSSASASACRSFDAQQQQKLRLPKPDETPKPRLAERISELAKQQRKFSEEIADKQSAGSPSDSQSPDGPAASPSNDPPGPTEEQQAAQRRSSEKADDIRSAMREDDRVTDLARRRMDEGARTVRESAEQLERGDQAGAGSKAALASEQLNRLASQVAALSAAELHERVAKARAMAQGLAKRQQGLARELEKQASDAGASRDQKAKAAKDAAGERALAADAQTLADLLKRLGTDAAEEDRDLSQALAGAARANSPAEAGERMEQAAEAIERGEGVLAAREARQAAASLAALSQELDEAQAQSTQAQLNELLAAEKQAAQTREAMRKVTGEGERGEAEKEMSELLAQLEPLAGGQARLAQPTQELKQAQAAAAADAQTDDQDPRGAYVPPQAYLNGLSRVIEALQATIQEMVLDQSQMDRDSPVPPEYRQLVDDYYRALSEDLR